MNHPLLLEWAKVAAGAAFWTCLLWPALVRVVWPWEKSVWGWNMVIKVELLAVALLASVLHDEFGINPGLPLLVTEIAAVTLIPVVIAWRTVIIWRTQRDGAVEDREKLKPR